MRINEYNMLDNCAIYNSYRGSHSIHGNLVHTKKLMVMGMRLSTWDNTFSNIKGTEGWAPSNQCTGGSLKRCRGAPENALGCERGVWSPGRL